jgi:ribosomal protein S18 acetylase RimI-like enzyme
MSLGKQAIYRRVAELHVANINQGFLGTLGLAFVSLMYQAIDEGENSVLIVAERSGQIVGFVSGAMGMRPVYKGMLRHWFRLGAALLPSSVRPRRVKRILEILRYSSNAKDSSHLPKAELLSVAVDPRFRGQQIAELLFKQLCDFFQAGRVSEFKIVVGENLGPAHKFYRRMGATPVDDVEVHQGASSTVYVFKLPS